MVVSYVLYDYLKSEVVIQHLTNHTRCTILTVYIAQQSDQALKLQVIITYRPTAFFVHINLPVNVCKVGFLTGK